MTQLRDDSRHLGLLSLPIGFLPIAIVLGSPWDLGVLLVLASIGIGTLLQRRNWRLPRDWKLWAFSVALYAALVLWGDMASSARAAPWRVLVTLAPLLCAVPACIAIARARTDEGTWWWGIVIASVLASVATLWPGVVSLRDEAAVLALLFAAVGLAGIGYFRERGHLLLAVPLFVALAALIAGFAALLAEGSTTANLLAEGWRAARCEATGAPCSEYLRAWAELGFAGLIALALLLGVPLEHCLRDMRHSDPCMRRLARSGLILVAAIAIGALAWPVLSDSALAMLLAGGLAFVYGLLRRAEATYYREAVVRTRPLSVIVICRDEADRIRDCLASVHGWAEQIVVLDSGSTDGTAAIARRYTDEVHVTDWPGYGPQKQRALGFARYPWVLSLDADEIVTAKLRHDIDVALANPGKHSGFRVPWAVRMYGRRILFGRQARAPLRLFRREGARFTLDLVHEKVVPAAGPIGTLRGALVHNTHRHFGHAIEKSACYAWLGAHRMRARGHRRSGLGLATLRALWAGFHTYVLRFGFLDGAVGYLAAIIEMQYTFNKYAGLWTLRAAGSTRQVATTQTQTAEPVLDVVGSGRTPA